MNKFETMGRDVRYVTIGGGFGLSIALSVMGFERHSMTLQLFGLWLLGVAIFALLVDMWIGQQDKN